MVRLKNRYLVVEILTDDNNTKTFNSVKLVDCILENVEKNYGEFGVAAIHSGFTAIYCNKKTNIAIIRARHGPHRFVSSTIPLITVINNVPARFRIIYIGATIKHCNKYIIKHQQNYIDQMIGSIKGNKDDFIHEVMKISN